MESKHYLKFRIGSKVYFQAGNKFAIFLRPSYVTEGNYPPVDIFDENEDEI